MPELAIQEPRPDVVVRPVHGLDPVRSLHAVWLRGRRVPAIPAMTRMLADAASARLGRSAAGL
jgi:DNA-binding transcriptional LysR family regulator